MSESYEIFRLKRHLAGAEFGKGVFDELGVFAAGLHVLAGESPRGIGFLFPVQIP